MQVWNPRQSQKLLFHLPTTKLKRKLCSRLCHTILLTSLRNVHMVSRSTLLRQKIWLMILKVSLWKSFILTTSLKLLTQHSNLCPYIWVCSLTIRGHRIKITSRTTNSISMSSWNMRAAPLRELVPSTRSRWAQNEVRSLSNTLRNNMIKAFNIF